MELTGGIHDFIRGGSSEEYLFKWLTTNLDLDWFHIVQKSNMSIVAMGFQDNVLNPVPININDYRLNRSGGEWKLSRPRYG